jgi:hypothetical protein
MLRLKKGALHAAGRFVGLRDRRHERSLDLAIAPDWESVKRAWDPCHALLLRAGIPEDDAELLAMVAQELLDNAVKYGSFHDGDRIALGVRVSEEAVTVQVKSRVGVDDAHLRRFDRTIQWIRGFQNPFEAYVERLKQLSGHPDAGEQGGLGLTRIAYEGRSIIDFYMEEGDLLAVSAFHRRDLPIGIRSNA